MILEVPQVQGELAVTAAAVGRVWEIIQRSPFLTSCKLLMSSLGPENQTKNFRNSRSLHFYQTSLRLLFYSPRDKHTEKPDKIEKLKDKKGQNREKGQNRKKIWKKLGKNEKWTKWKLEKLKNEGENWKMNKIGKN